MSADPRRLGPAELAALGHQPQPLAAVIRAKCLDCCGGDAGEVRACPVTGCALWPYRMGANPFARRSLSPEQREARRQSAALARAAKAGKAGGSVRP